MTRSQSLGLFALATIAGLTVVGVIGYRFFISSKSPSGTPTKDDAQEQLSLTVPVSDRQEDSEENHEVFTPPPAPLFTSASFFPSESASPIDSLQPSGDKSPLIKNVSVQSLAKLEEECGGLEFPSRGDRNAAPPQPT